MRNFLLFICLLIENPLFFTKNIQNTTICFSPCVNNKNKYLKDFAVRFQVSWG